MAKMPILERDEKGMLVEHESPYEGPLTLPVIKYVNDRVKGMDATNFCYPMDALDMYAQVFEELEQVAETLDPAALTDATPETYLGGVAKNIFKKFFTEEVRPRREEYRAVEGLVDKADDAANAKSVHNAPEGDDAGYESYASAAEGYTAEVGESSLAAQPLTVQQLADNLPSEPSAEERRAAAQAELALIYAELPDDIVRAFTAFLVAECNLVEAAHLCHISKNRFYEKWPVWLKMARRVAKK